MLRDQEITKSLNEYEHIIMQKDFLELYKIVFRRLKEEIKAKKSKRNETRL